MTIEMNLQKGLVGHWTMNSVDTQAGVVKDKTARSNDAVINGATSDHLGRIATGFSFSGNGEDLVGPDIPATRSNPFTATAWVLISDDYPSNVSGNMSPIAVRTNGNVKWSLHYRNPNGSDSRKFEIFIRGNGGIYTEDTFQEQKWHFVAVTDDGTDLKLRVNNTLSTDSGGGGTTFFSGESEPFRIGATRQGKESWQGNIDDVRYYNRVLSDKELDALYNIRSDRSYGSPYVPQRPVAAGDLVAWYPFEAGDAVDATAFQTWAGDDTDYSGTVNGATYQETGGVADIRRGVNSGAFDFDDANDVIQLPSSFTMGNRTQFTVCFWADLVNRGRIVVEDKGGGFNSNGTFEFIYNGGNGILYMVRDNSGNAVNTVAGPTSGLHHLAISFDNGKFDCYSDASVVAGLDTGDSVANTGSDNISIGATDGNDDNFGGKVDDVRFYNRALTESEIFSIYNNTKP